MRSLKPRLLSYPLLTLTLKANPSWINSDNIKSGATIRAVSIDHHAEPPGILSGLRLGLLSAKMLINLPLPLVLGL
jgi:hypothetical protein